jgi:hypothetical protein
VTLRELAVGMIAGGVCALLGYVAGVKEGLERAGRMWRGR